MKVAVTGATGFLGRHLCTQLVARGHEVIGLSRRGVGATIACDVNGSEIPREVAGAAVLVHLAWPGLPNYRAAFHTDVNLFAAYRFILQVVAAGVRRVLVAGTCLEYGLQEGALSETMPTHPTTAYGAAKDCLRRLLAVAALRDGFALQWARLFYLWGPGQPAGSLMGQLEAALARGEQTFEMSRGDQLRDYLPVGEAARKLCALIEHPECTGIVNCSSGVPVSVRTLVERRLSECGASMALQLGARPYPDYEPMAFWGAPGRLESLG